MTTLSRILIVHALLAVPALASPLAAPAEMHVTLVGDSLAYGAGDESGRGIAGHLEPALRSRGFGSIVTTNLGVTGATTRDLEQSMNHPATRTAIARADAVVVSIGANDFRDAFLGGQRERSPLLVIDQVLRNIDSIVGEIRHLNPDARILVLGGYTPIAHERAAALLEPVIAIWDGALMAQFDDDPLVSVVRLSDIVNRPDRLSRVDSFHPGSEAYQETAKRIADLLTPSPAAVAQ